MDICVKVCDVLSINKSYYQKSLLGRTLCFCRLDELRSFHSQTDPILICGIPLLKRSE